MVDTHQIKGLGYIPDLYNFRDFSPDHDEVKKIYASIPGLKTSLSAAAQTNESLPAKTDLRNDFTTIMDQQSLGSCTAHAGAALIQYFEKKSFGSYTDASRRFIYKVTRETLHLQGDTGASLRSTMGTLTLFGAPPEEYWPYNGAPADPSPGNPDFDIEPPAFCYAFAQNYKSVKYVRLDQPNLSTPDVLNSIKHYLTTGLPSMFGFTCYESLWQSKKNGGNIPFPGDNENIIGGHAIVMAGYDDQHRIKNDTSDKETVGAFLIRNSWGSNFGEEGYGWIPYEYVLKGVAQDFWTVISIDWVSSEQFKGDK